MNDSAPSVRPLGYLALGTALTSAALSWTYLFSVFALIPAVVAVPLGLAARDFPATHRMGTVALALTALSMVVAAAVLFAA